MPGRKCTRRLGTIPGRASGKRRGWAATGASLLALCAGVNNCSFPDYAFHGATSVGGAGGFAGTLTGAGAGQGGGGGSGLIAGTDGGGDAGSAGAVGGSAAGGSEADAGDSGAGSGGTPCVYPTPVSYPEHCFDRAAGDGETGIDCGGIDCPPCSGSQACARASDCLSNQCSVSNVCVPLITLTYFPIETKALTIAPKFRLNFTYSGANVPLSDLTVRYYFNHNGVTEPVFDPSPQATVLLGNTQTEITSAVITAVHRFPLGPLDQSQRRTDSYLEIGFASSTTVIPGAKFEITQQVVASSSTTLFDQNSHYSFKAAPGINEGITVHRRGEVIWGVAPPMELFPACAFAQAVNLNGPALTIRGESLVAETAASITFGGGAVFSNPAAKPLPSADANTTKLLTTARTLNTGDSAVWSVSNGKYWAYAWLTSTASSDSGTLRFGDTSADRFFGLLNGTPAAARWALVGPYSVDVTNGTLTLTADGSVHIAGLKLYEAAAP